MMVLIHSTCKKQIIKCRHKSCSSCKTSSGEWSPSVQSLSPTHPVPDQIPVGGVKGCGQKVKIQILGDLKISTKAQFVKCVVDGCGLKHMINTSVLDISGCGLVPDRGPLRRFRVSSATSEL